LHYAPADTLFYTSTGPCELFGTSPATATVDGGAFPACVNVSGGGVACAVPGY